MPPIPIPATLMNPRVRRLVARYAKRAATLLRDPAALDQLAKDSRRKVAGTSNSRVRELADQVKQLGRLIRAYANGSYREISAANIGLVVAGILYFVTPLDLVPDAIPGAGLIDDASVIAFVLARLEGELARFTAWERADAITIE